MTLPSPEARRLATLVYEHLLSTGRWPSPRSLRVALFKEGIREFKKIVSTEDVVRGSDVQGRQATTTITLKGLGVVDAAASDRDALVKLVTHLGDEYLKNPEQRGISARELSTSLELENGQMFRLLQILEAQGTPFHVTGAPEFILDSSSIDVTDAFLDAVAEPTFDTIVRMADQADVLGPFSGHSRPTTDKSRPNVALIEMIDKGAFADVWRAEDALGRTVAAKVVRASMATESSALDHARALARASHKNVVTVFGLGNVILPGTNETVDAVIMEFLEGRTLKDELDTGHLAGSAALDIADALLEGLGHLHSVGVPHCDLHANNVMLTKSGPKIID